MTIVEMTEWLEQIEPGAGESALRDAFGVCLTDPETRERLAAVIRPLRGTEWEAFCLALGLYIATAALNLLEQAGAPHLERLQ